MGQLTVRQVVVIAAIFVAGVAIDHVFVGRNESPTPSRVSSSPTPSGPIASDSTANPAAAEQQHSADSNSKTKNKLDSILGEHDSRQRMADLQSFIGTLAPGQYADALKRIRKIPGSADRELASRMLIAQWAQNDANGALQFAASNAGYEHIADDVFQHEAANDLQGAIDRALALPSPDLRYQALRGVVSFMADTDPNGALALSLKAGEFPGNEPLNSVIYREWATTDPQAAAARAAQDSTGGWRSPVGQVVRTWASQDPAAAANWSLSLNDPQEASHAVSQVVRQWTRADLNAATNWVNALPAGQSRDSATAGVALSLAPNDVQTAVNWANTIEDESARTNALQRLSREVLWRDPSNGNAALQAAGVPANLIPPPGQQWQRGR